VRRSPQSGPWQPLLPVYFSLRPLLLLPTNTRTWCALKALPEMGEWPPELGLNDFGLTRSGGSLVLCRVRIPYWPRPTARSSSRQSSSTLKWWRKSKKRSNKVGSHGPRRKIEVYRAARAVSVRNRVRPPVVLGRGRPLAQNHLRSSPRARAGSKIMTLLNGSKWSSATALPKTLILAKTGRSG
jgi:hypothetical protein